MGNPTVAQLSALEDSQWPDRVGRYKRRRKESLEDFQGRIFQMYSEGKINPSEKKGPVANDLHNRSTDTVQILEEVFGEFLLSEEVLETSRRNITEEDEPDDMQAALLMLSQKGLDNPYVDMLKLSAPAPSEEGLGRIGEDYLTDVRIAMAWWVEETRTVKACEASCDLDCLGCGSAQLLSCVSANKSPLKDYGIDLESILTEPKRT